MNILWDLTRFNRLLIIGLMKLLTLIKKLAKRKYSNERSYFAERQFEELAKKNISLPIKLYHL